MRARAQTQVRDPGDQAFKPAPAGGRVRWMLFFVLAVFIAIAGAVGLTGALVEKTTSPLAFLAPLIGLPIAGLVWFSARIRCFRLSGDMLVVERAWHSPRVPLDGLDRADVEPGAVDGARKLFGNDGLGAMAGRFHNRRLGRFRAYVTNGDKTVVLRWPDRILVVSPDRAHEFAGAVRKRAGLRR